ncbi:MAG: hypothetical protein A2007_05810 [Verrucomicrobia bacterium GWC2_42_7]|nr:MAG: hypothetical protein A2007_05810 [Verrucomicrobia bacterium GWC2_42_7]
MKFYIRATSPFPEGPRKSRIYLVTKIRNNLIDKLLFFDWKVWKASVQFIDKADKLSAKKRTSPD